MTLKYLLLLALTVICSVEPIEVVVTYHNLTGLVAADERRYTVVSHNEIVETSQGRLSLKHLNGTLISEAVLGYQPDELYSYSLNDATHIVAAAHAEQSLLNKVSHCTYYATRDPGLICHVGETFTPPTKFVVSILVDESNVAVWAIYFDDSDLEYKVRELIAGTPTDQLPLILRENCVCNNHSNCLKPHDEPNGKVRVQCDNGASYLYDVYSEFSYVTPPNVKRVATSRYRNLIFAVQPAEGQFQDTLIVTNMVTDLKHAAAQPLRLGVVANSSNPATIQDVAVVPVNETSQLEVCFYIRSNKISYFEVVDLGTFPVIESLQLHPDLTPIAIRDTYKSTVVVAATGSNGTLVLITIEVVQPGDQGTNKVNDTTGSNNNLTTSCTPPPHPTKPPPPPPTKPSRPHTTDKPTKPTDNDDPAKSISTNGSSNDFGTPFTCGFFTGFILALAIVTVILLLWRFSCCLRKHREYDINNAERKNPS